VHCRLDVRRKSMTQSLADRRCTQLAALSAAATSGDKLGVESEEARAGTQPWIGWSDAALSGKGGSLGVKNNHGSGGERGACPVRVASPAYN